MKTIKRIMAFMLAMLLVSSACPLSALAEEVERIPTEADKFCWDDVKDCEDEGEYFEQFDLSGTESYTKNGVTYTTVWNWDADTKTLYVDMPDEGRLFKPTNSLYYDKYYVYDETDKANIPEAANSEGYWETFIFHYYYVEHLVIGKHVETIEYQLRTGTKRFENLVDISFEEGSQLKTLGYNVFLGLRSNAPVNITLPDTVETLGINAFRDSSFNSITLPSSVKELGTGCFCNANIDVLDLSQTQITDIPQSCFKSATINQLILPSNLKTINKSAFENLTCDTVTFPSSVEALDEMMFDSSNINRIDLSQTSITEIPECCFADITNMPEIILPQGITAYGKGAFSGYKCDTFVVPSSIEEIGEGCFECADIRVLDLSQTSITEIPDYCFSAMVNVEELILPNTVQKIGEHAFDGISVETLNIPNSVTEIGAHAFRKASVKNGIDLSLNEITLIPDYCFAYIGDDTEIRLPVTVEEIGQYAFREAGIRSIFIPSSLMKLGQYAFYKCENLESVDLSATVIQTLDGAFNSCSSLSELKLPTGLKTFKNGVVNCPALESLEIPEGVTTLTGLSNSGVKTVNFPTSLTTIGDMNSLQMSTLDFSELTSGDVWNGLEIEGETFKDNQYITSVIFPKRHYFNVRSNLFRGCSNLKSVKFYGGETIEYGAFAETALERVEISDSCKTIYGGAFEDCKELTYVRMPKHLRFIKDGDPFSGCTNLETVVYRSTLLPKPADTSRYNNEERCFAELAGSGFLLQEGLTVYLYPDTPIERYCVLNNIHYEYIDWEMENIYSEGDDDHEEEPPEQFSTKGTFEYGTWQILSYTSAGPWSDNRNYGLVLNFDEDCTVTSRALTCDTGYETTIEELVNKYALKNINFTGNGEVKIGDNFMYGFRALSNYSLCISFGGNVKSVGENAFRTAGINTIWLGGVREVAPYAFADNTGLRNIQWNTELTRINEGVFYNTALLYTGSQYVARLTIPDTVEYVDKKAFGARASKTNVEYLVDGDSTEIYSDPQHPWNNAFGVTADGYVDNYITVLLDKDSYAYRYVKDYGIRYTIRRGSETEEEQNAPPKYDLSIPPEITPETAPTNVMTGILGRDDWNLKPSSSTLTWTYYRDTKTLIVRSSDTTYTSLNSLNLYYNNLQKVDLNDFEVDDLVLLGTFNTLYGEEYARNQADWTDQGKNFVPLSAFNPKRIDFSSVNMKSFYSGAFKDCTRLESITIPAGAVLGNNIFGNNPSLKGIEIKSMENIPKDFLSNNKTLEFIKLPENLYSIGARAFAYCTNLQKIEIPDSCVAIGAKAFYKCVNVQSVKLGKNLRQVSKDAFSDLAYCEKVTVNSPYLVMSETYTGIENKKQFMNLGEMTAGVTVEYGANIENADFTAFDSKNVTKIILGENVSALTSPESLTKLKEITLAENNQSFYLENGMLYQGSTLLLAPRNITDIAIKAGTTEIGRAAFYKTQAKIVKVPSGVTKIGELAFAGSDTLKSVTMNKGVVEIGNGAFKNCDKIRAILLPGGLKTIGDSAFEGCDTLASVILNEELEAIGKKAFRACPALRGIVIPQSVQTVGERAFENCETLEYAYIWDAQLEDGVFNGDELVEIYTMLSSNPYAWAKLNGVKVNAYTDEDSFFTEAAMKLDIEAGYIGYCDGEHGDIEWLTVYEADCENDGYMIGVCEYCSEVLAERHIDSYGHDYKKIYETQPTASLRGGALYTCSRCHTSKFEYSDEAAPDGQEISTQKVTGRVLIADSRNASTGKSPAEKAWIMEGENKLAETDENGNFSLSLESGIYYLRIRYAYGFERWVTVVVEDKDVENVDIPIIGCDFNKDGAIDDADTKLFRIALSATKNDPAYLDYVDLNSDGYINAKDFAIILKCDGLSSDTFAYSELVFK